MNITQRSLIMQRWHVLQHDLLPELKQEWGALTARLEKLVHILDWVRIEEWSVQTWQGIGRKPHDRSALANAFVAKAVLGLSTTRALIERLAMDRVLKRLCGFSMWQSIPDEATFSRAFAEFAQAELPKACDRGTKCNAQGYKQSWNGYKLHIDTADCGVPVSVLLTSASVHDSQTAVPLATMTAQRVTNLYDLMDAAYCSVELHEHSRQLQHVPLIDHNPRGGKKEPFEPADAIRYKERSQAERTNARLKDEFGGRNVRVRGPVKVMSHLMFGVLALTADQLMRLLT